jgi:hypothetical protein
MALVERWSPYACYKNQSINRGRDEKLKLFLVYAQKAVAPSILRRREYEKMDAYMEFRASSS